MNFSNLKTSLTFWILASLVMGALVGYLFPDFAKELDILGKVFLKLIKTIVAPLLFATLIVGIAGHGDSKTVGRMGVKAFSYFIAVTWPRRRSPATRHRPTICRASHSSGRRPPDRSDRRSLPVAPTDLAEDAARPST